MKAMLYDKQVEQEKDVMQSGPPICGSYFSKAGTALTESKESATKVKKPKSGKVYCSTRVYSGYKPKALKFRHLQVADDDGPFMHDMSGTFYTDSYRFFQCKDGFISLVDLGWFCVCCFSFFSVKQCSQ